MAQFQRAPTYTAADSDSRTTSVASTRPPPAGAPMCGLPSPCASTRLVQLSGAESWAILTRADHCGSVRVIMRMSSAAGRETRLRSSVPPALQSSDARRPRACAGDIPMASTRRAMADQLRGTTAMARNMPSIATRMNTVSLVANARAIRAELMYRYLWRPVSMNRHMAMTRLSAQKAIRMSLRAKRLK